MVNVALLWSYVELMDMIDAGPMWLAFQEWILGRGVRSANPPPPPNGLQFSNITSELHKICCIVFCVFSAVHVMLLTSHKPSSLLFTFENFYHRRSPVKNHGSALSYFFYSLNTCCPWYLILCFRLSLPGPHRRSCDTFSDNVA